jgi:hypothetical protein
MIQSLIFLTPNSRKIHGPITKKVTRPSITQNLRRTIASIFKRCSKQQINKTFTSFKQCQPRVLRLMDALVRRANVCVVQGANVDVALASRVIRSPVVVANAILFVVGHRLARAHAVHRVDVHHRVVVAGVVVAAAIMSKLDSQSFLNLHRRSNSVSSFQFVHLMIHSI